MTLIVRQGADAHTAEAALCAVLTKRGPAAFAGQSVLIKPNVGRVSTPGTGVCTHPEVVRGAIRAARSHGASQILVGDGPIWGVDVSAAMVATGIQSVCDAEGVECVDLDAYGSLELSIPDGIVVDRLRFSALIRQVDSIISVPVLKTHMYTVASLSIKNMKGCLYKMEKTKLHRLNRPVPDERKGRVLDYGIADLARVLLPDYVLMDGTIGLEGLGPSVGTPRPLGLVLAGDDAVAADMAAVQLMGFAPDAVPHLNLIRELLRPDLDPNTLEVDPPTFRELAVPFEPASLIKLDTDFPHLRLVERGTCSACSAAMMVFMRTHGHKLPPSACLLLATGKDLTPEVLDPDTLFCTVCTTATATAPASCATPGTPPRTVCIGNCAMAIARSLDLPCCPGCPPVGSSILAHIMGTPETDW